MSALDPRRLETFRIVALCGRISEAARHLNLSQPAVTAQVQQLEAALGRPLFLRARSGVQLTPAGRRLLETAEAIHRLLGEAEGSLAEPATTPGPLRLGASTTAASYLVPALLARYQRTYPGSQMMLEVGNTDQVQAWVREGRVDLGMVEGLRRAAGLRLEAYRDDELVCVGPAVAPPGLALPASVGDLAQVTVLWREPGSGTRAVVARALGRLRPPRLPRPGDPVLGDTEAIKAAVRAGMGIAFLPRCAIQVELSRGELRILDVPGLTIRRSFAWVVPAGGAAGSAARFQRLSSSGG